MIGGPSGRESSRARAGLIAIRGVWGFALVLDPRRLLLTASAPVPAPVLLTARVLGGRHLAEALLLGRHPDRPPPVWSIAVDGLHALSMLFVAAVSPRFRRDAAISATCALSLAGLSSYER